MRKRIVVDRGEIKKISKDFKVTSKAVCGKATQL